MEVESVYNIQLLSKVLTLKDLLTCIVFANKVESPNFNTQGEGKLVRVIGNFTRFHFTVNFIDWLIGRTTFQENWRFGKFE